MLPDDPQDNILHPSVPAVLSLIAGTMASVADTGSAGHPGSVSVDALPAMGLLAPVLYLFTSVQVMLALYTYVFIAGCLNRCKERGGYFYAVICVTPTCSVILSGTR